MRLFVIISLLTLTTSCTYERVFIGDVDKLTENQLKNNRIEIDRIKREIREFKIAHFKKNISLMEKLDQLHKNIEILNDSLDLVDRDIALNKTITFITQNFSELDFFNEIPLELDQDTPRPLLKLHVSTLEANLIRQNRMTYDFGHVLLRFDHMTAQIKPSKTIIKSGEKISLEFLIVAESNVVDLKDVLKKVTLNGNEILIGKDGWKFEITPTSEGKGLVPFELNSEMTLNDTTVLKGKNTIYIQN